MANEQRTNEILASFVKEYLSNPVTLNPKPARYDSYQNQAFVNTADTIYEAANSGLPEDIKKIQNLKNYINSTNRQGYTPLMLAANEGDLQAILTLLKAGADINACGSNGKTPLMCAHDHDAGREQVIINVLIKNGAGINAQDRQGYTPLMHAIKNNVYPQNIDQLVKAGADLTLLTKQGENVLDIIRRHVKSEELAENITKIISNSPQYKQLEEQIKERAREAEEAPFNQLVEAVRSNNLGDVAKALAGCKDVNKPINDNGFTLLMSAATRGNEHIVNMLLKHGANPNATDKSGYTAYDYAKEFNNRDVAAALRESPYAAAVQVAPPSVVNEKIAPTPITKFGQEIVEAQIVKLQETQKESAREPTASIFTHQNQEEQTVAASATRQQPSISRQ